MLRDERRQRLSVDMQFAAGQIEICRESTLAPSEELPESGSALEHHQVGEQAALLKVTQKEVLRDVEDRHVDAESRSRRYVPGDVTGGQAVIIADHPSPSLPGGGNGRMVSATRQRALWRRSGARGPNHTLPPGLMERASIRSGAMPATK